MSHMTTTPAAEPTPRDLLDPEIAAVVDLIPFQHMTADVLPTLRLDFEMPGADGVERTDHLVPGDPPVPVRVHRAPGDERVLPCLYSIHGGGYVIGRHTFDDGMMARLCPAIGLVGVSVDYRLAPETPYPGPLEDCYRGLQWVLDNAGELGVDPERIGVIGGSAGGGLAAALALLCRDRGGPALAFQVLDSPMLDDRQVTASSRRDGLPVWSRESNEFGWRAYLGDLYGRDDVPPTAAAARATDLSGLPPAYVSVGAVDGFLDEDVDYATRLARAGVPVDLRVYAGACHGYGLAAEAAVTRRSERDLDEWLAARVR